MKRLTKRILSAFKVPMSAAIALLILGLAPVGMTQDGNKEEINLASLKWGATAKASSVYGESYEANNALDGCWQSRETDKWNSAANKTPHWLMIDLGAVRTIHRIVIRHEGALADGPKYNTSDFTLQRGDSPNGPWVALLPPVRGAKENVTTHKFDPVKTRFVRLAIEKGEQKGNEYARIFEVEIYGMRAAQEAPLAEKKIAPPALDERALFWKDGTIHVLSSSHQDMAWMNDLNACKDYRINSCILPALELMAKKKDYCFVMENMVNLMEFLERYPDRKEEIRRLTAEGRLEWGATFNQPYEGLLSGEELVRETYYGRRWLKKNFPGCDAVVAFNPDVPGRSLQMQQILKKAGIPYLIISRFHEGLWNWKSPDGTGVIAYTPGHYCNAEPIFKAKPEQGVRLVLSKMKSLSGYYQQHSMPPALCLLHSQDFSRPTDFDPLVNAWNQTAGVAKMHYSSARGFFEAAGKNAPKFQEIVGERPDLWLYIHGPTHHWAISAKREAAVLLPAAEMFQTIRCMLAGSFKDYPEKELAEAWMNEIYADHGWGGKMGHSTDIVFKKKAEAARDFGRKKMEEAQQAIAARVKTASDKGLPILIYNDLAWARTEVVQLDLIANCIPGEPLRVTDADGKETRFQIVVSPIEVNVAASALGSKATASSAFGPDCGAEKAIDGRWFVRETDKNLTGCDRWNSGKDAKGPHWLVVDFGQTRLIHKVVIKHEGVLGAFKEEEKYNTVDFRIQRAEAPDGPWTDLTTPVAGNKAVLTTHVFEPKTFQYLRLNITKGAAADDMARIYEVEAFSSKYEAPVIKFVAAGVPAIGYKTYYLKVSPPSSEVQIKKPFAPVMPSGSGYENEFFKIIFAAGGLKSIHDKQLNTELLDTSKFLGGEIFTMQSVGNGAGEFGRVQQPTMQGFDKMGNRKPEWKRSDEESGAIQTVFTMKQPLPECTIRQKLILYEGIKRIDFDVSILNWNGAKYREWRMALPVAAPGGQVAYEVPMGVVEVGKDEIPTSGGHAYAKVFYDDLCKDIRPREVQNFIYAGSDKFGLTISSDVAAFDYRDPTPDAAPYPIIQPILLASRKSCHGEGNWYLQPGDHHYRFSLFSHEPGWRAGWKQGVAANHPLRAVQKSLAPATAGAVLPESMSFCSLSAPGAAISTIKKCEDDDSVILRCYDMEGKDSAATIRFFTPAQSAERTNLIEEEGKPLAVSGGAIGLDLGHHAIETVRARFARQP